MKSKIRKIIQFALNPRNMAIILIVVIFLAFLVKKNDIESEKKAQIISNSENYIDFPDISLVDKYKNPGIYDLYRGVFGLHFNNKYLKIGDYKLLVLNEDSTCYIFDNYWSTDDLLDASLGGNYYKIKTDINTASLFEDFKEKRKADLVEQFDGHNFYFYVLQDEYDWFNNTVNQINIERNPNGDTPNNTIRDYFDVFGYPAEWCKSVCDISDWPVDFNNDFWNDFNYNQKIIVPKKEGYDPNNWKTYAIVYVYGVNDFVCKGDDYNSIEKLDFFFNSNGYVSLYEGIEFTNELNKEYYIDLF